MIIYHRSHLLREPETIKKIGMKREGERDGDDCEVLFGSSFKVIFVWGFSYIPWDVGFAGNM